MVDEMGRAAALAFDRVVGIGAHDKDLRADLLDTAMLRPLGFVTAGLPRLAVAMIALVSAPIDAAVAADYPMAAVLFTVLAAGTAVLMLQNNRTLLAVLRAEREARRLAVTDPLTGLLNRAGFKAALKRYSGQNVTLICLDLDGFKLVNDRHGHGAGDAVLVEVGRRLRAVGGEAPVGRLGGDEFAMIIPDDDLSRALSTSAAIRVAIEQPIAIEAGRMTVRVGASCGSPSGLLTSGEATMLLAEADRAVYEMKGTVRHSAERGNSAPLEGRERESRA